MENHHVSLEKSPKIAMFNSYVNVYQRVFTLHFPISAFPMMKTHIFPFRLFQCKPGHQLGYIYIYSQHLSIRCLPLRIRLDSVRRIAVASQNWPCTFLVWIWLPETSAMDEKRKPRQVSGLRDVINIFINIVVIFKSY